MDKKRLDVHMVEAGLAPSREKARAMIMAGEVFINGRKAIALLCAVLENGVQKRG